MNAILAALDGKKTYIIAAGIAIGSAAQYLGYQIPEWVWMLANAAGVGTIRSAIGKAQFPGTPGSASPQP